MKITEKPWEADRGFIDAGDTNYHYTIDDEFMTVYCGRDAIDNFDPEEHDYIEIHGPNQEANAQAIEVLPELLEALENCVNAINQVKVFVNSREKIKQPEGQEWLEDQISTAVATINKARGQEVKDETPN